MAIEGVVYLSYAEAVAYHIELMWYWGETRCGVFSRHLIESALARPQQAAVWEHADLPRQAATLCFGLIKNHPWLGGNKRTATFLTERFLNLNGREVLASASEILEMVHAIESDQWDVDQIERWMRRHIQKAQSR
ncbi:MAG TPA: type II toxin-antitoxin system death-on-curing family toxin [Blastocatellia bacterium]|nr:type II toxin-antitoxin system death-on-curing family toxin [Blastocatellia bacterium]